MRDGLSKANVVLFILKKIIFVSEGDEEGMENWPISRPPGTPKSVFFLKNSPILEEPVLPITMVSGFHQAGNVFFPQLLAYSG